MDFIFDPSLVLYLPLYEPDSSSLMSKDAYGHLAAVTGATWGTLGRTFDGSDDQIDCGNASSLVTAFGGDTTGSYTYLWWQKVASAPLSCGLLNKGADPA
ncbi:MAG: hypothetical protein Q7K41_02790, partial [Dehalococcoidales bacterium]|nr:hypothetical protein [Dehalococcoidales bacterium]